jgi:tRNA dimethylallyltransferase
MASRAAPDAARVIALAGPTASGKSGAALAIAQRHGAEIVSVDSALVYRGMDIGTAKPSAADRGSVPHHLIDIRDPRQAYSAAQFLADAKRLVREINGRGKPALLVGGTMLYFKAWFDGLDPMPKADPAVRAELEAQAAQEGWPALHAELARVDPAAAARLAPGDAQRIQRALEVFRVSGQPWSSFHVRKDGVDSAAWLDTPLFSLEPVERGWLHQRIAQRFDAMLAAGFLQEVKALRERGDLSADVPSMRCVGYRQAWQWLDEAAAGSPVALGQLRDRGIFATRQLAKRQLTWLRAMPRRRVIACDAPDALAQLLRAMEPLA